MNDNCCMEKLPKIINIELTNRCNIACLYCAHKFMKRKPADMTREVIDCCMDRAKEAGIRQVSLNTIGETLIAKELGYALRACTQNGLLSLLSTNGQALTEPMAKMLIENKLSIFRFSVNAIDKEKYERLHCGASFDVLLHNALMLKALRNKSNSNMRIRVRMVLTDSSQPIDEYKKFWDTFADDVEFVFFGNMGGRNGKAPSSNGPRTACLTMKRGINITVNGDVTYCPCDFDAECIVGNIKENSFQEIWEGERFSKVRQAHNEHDFSELQKCNYCDATHIDWYQKKKPSVTNKEAEIMDSYLTNWRNLQ